MDIVVKRRWHPSLPLLVWYGQVSPLTNQIPGLFDWQYFWENSIDILVIHAWS